MAIFNNKNVGYRLCLTNFILHIFILLANRNDPHTSNSETWNIVLQGAGSFDPPACELCAPSRITPHTGIRGAYFAWHRSRCFPGKAAVKAKPPEFSLESV